MNTIEKRAARWFRFMGLLGLILSLVFFMVYVFNLIHTDLSAEESMLLWSEAPADKVFEFRSGWFLNFEDSYILSSTALALLASSALPTLFVLSLSWFCRRDFLYGGISLLLTGILLISMFSF